MSQRRSSSAAPRSSGLAPVLALAALSVLVGITGFWLGRGPSVIQEAAAPAAPQGAAAPVDAAAPVHDTAPAVEVVGNSGELPEGAPSAPQAAAAEALQPAYVPAEADDEPDGLAAAERGELGTPALVMFHADWCHVCQEAMPTVHDLRDRYRGRAAVLKVNVDSAANNEALERYRVSGTPTFVLLARDGSLLRNASGWSGEQAMTALLDGAVAMP